MFHNVLGVFYDVLLVVHDVFHNVLQVFHEVLRCLVSRVTIGIGDCAAADRLRDRDNAAGIGDNYAEIGDNATGMGDIAVKVIPC